MLRDSARLLAEEADHANAHGWSKRQPAVPLYTEEDVDRAVRLFTPVQTGQPVRVSPDVELILRHAGHILGSAWAELRIAVAGGYCRLVSGGDLGRPGHPLLLPPEPLSGGGAILVEATYGNRRHGGAELRAAFAKTISRTLRRGGSAGSCITCGHCFPTAAIPS